MRFEFRPYPLALLALVSAAPPDSTPGQFNMFCKGQTQRFALGVKDGPAKKWKSTFRIDRGNGRYCRDACHVSNSIRLVDQSRIELRQLNSQAIAEFEQVDISQLVYFGERSRQLGIVMIIERTHAKCKLLPFTGLGEKLSPNPSGG